MKTVENDLKLNNKIFTRHSRQFFDKNNDAHIPYKKP